MRVAVIGGGVGGLTAATRLAMLGHKVQIFEARDDVGGLASGFQREGVWFDGGPYILLDRPGLEWALERIGLDVGPLNLKACEDLYEVTRPSSGASRHLLPREKAATNSEPSPAGRGWREAPDEGRSIHIFLDLQRTVSGLGDAGAEYEKFVNKMDAVRVKLAPLLRISHPSLFELAKRGSLSVAPFLLRSLGSVLRELPAEVKDAVAIWTHVAGQDVSSAPSVMAFIPALIHRVGAFVPSGGMRAIPKLLAENARRAGVEIQCGRAIRRVATRNGRAVGVDDEPFDAVISNYHGVGTYDELVDVPQRIREKLRALPLQSPGVCAYLTATNNADGPYLRFRLDDHQLQLRVSAGKTIRLIMPLRRGTSEQEQTAELQRMIDAGWWREGLQDVKVVHTRTVGGWGREMHLYRDSMNPVMTRRLMLSGRIAHRSPWVKGLYLAGASTHPGQWVSFCAISGILAADLLHSDHAAHAIR